MKTLGLLAAGMTIGIILCWMLMPKGSPKIINTTDTVYTDTGSFHISDRPVPYKVEVEIPGDTFWLPSNVDTAAIMDSCYKLALAYFQKKSFDSTYYGNDMSANLKYQVWQNDIDSLFLDLKNNRATVINNTTDIIYTKELFLEGELSTKSIEGSILFQNDAWIFEVGYQHIFPLDKSFVKAGVGYRIKQW
jgi:hypothetical protein